MTAPIQKTGNYLEKYNNKPGFYLSDSFQATYISLDYFSREKKIKV